MFQRLFLTSLGLIAITAVWFFSERTSCADDAQTTTLLQTFMSEFVAITPGEGSFPAEFEMGNNEGETNERPRHSVKMSGHVFAMAKYEVPQDFYEAILGSNPSRWKGPRNSVEMMTWDDANLFCKKVTELARSQKFIGDDEIIRLPSEVEWEYCCRAGTTTLYSFGDEAQSKGDVSPKASYLNQYGWHTGNAAGNDPPVGALKPNPWGLFDMHGYLWEFTSDDWSVNYQKASTEAAAGKSGEESKSIAIRSGSWKDDFRKLTSSTRRPFLRSDKDDAVGFRCVKSKIAK
jgi:formylglycine-generating enzyme required for sulfatase activity